MDRCVKLHPARDLGIGHFGILTQMLPVVHTTIHRCISFLACYCTRCFVICVSNFEGCLLFDLRDIFSAKIRSCAIFDVSKLNILAAYECQFKIHEVRMKLPEK